MIMRRARAGAILAAVFLWDVVRSSLSVARIVLSPSIRTKPAIVAVPIAVREPWAVALFAYFTSLTPGSTCLHVSQDRRTLYLHVLDASDPHQSAMRFKRLYERWIAEMEA